MNTTGKDNKKYYIAHADLMKLVMDFGDLTTNDLGRWLMTKTADNFTVIEVEFIKQACFIIENIGKSVELFRKKWPDEYIGRLS